MEHGAHRIPSTCDSGYLLYLHVISNMVLTTLARSSTGKSSRKGICNGSIPFFFFFNLLSFGANPMLDITY